MGPDQDTNDTTVTEKSDTDQTTQTGDALDTKPLIEGDEPKLDADGKPIVEAKPELDADGKPIEKKDDAAPALVGEVPEAYSLTAPEGYTLDPEVMGMFQDTFKKLTLTNAGAQELLNATPKFVDLIAKNVSDQFIGSIVDVRKQWQDATNKDPEIGGANLETAQRKAAMVFDGVGIPEDGPFRKMLRDTGLGDHPDMIRTFSKIADLIGEDGFDRGEGAATSKQEPWDRAYGGPTPAS
jgi:hypothetical protein